MEPIGMNRRGMSAVALAGLGIFVSVNMASAAVVETDTLSTSSQSAYTASATDLIDQSQLTTFANQTSSGFTNGFNSGGPSKLNDGSIGADSNTADTTISLTDWTTTFHLNTSSNALGYTLSGINTIAGWPDNRVNQKYKVYYSTVSSNPSNNDSTGYSLLQSVDYEPSPGGPNNTASSTGGNSTEVSLAISGLSGINAIQFVLNSGTPTADSNGDNLESVYREFDAFGAATTPEPASLSLLGLGGLALLARRCRI